MNDKYITKDFDQLLTPELKSKLLKYKFVFHLSLGDDDVTHEGVYMSEAEARSALNLVADYTLTLQNSGLMVDYSNLGVIYYNLGVIYRRDNDGEWIELED